MKRYSLGLTGMEEDPNGLYCSWVDCLANDAEWERNSERNKAFAETLMKQQDEDIAEKNKIIVELKKIIKAEGE